MLDSIQISPMIIIGLIGLLFLVFMILIVILMKYLGYRKDINDFCPEADVLTSARKNRHPIGLVIDAGSGYTRFFELTKKTRSSFEYDVNVKDIGLKLTSEYSKHCQPCLFYGDLPVYVFSTMHAQALGIQSILALNNLERLRGLSDFAKLRFLTTEDLYTLMKCPSIHLKHDCDMFFTTYNNSNCTLPMPESISEFVELVGHAKDVFASMTIDGEPDPDTLDDASSLEPTGEFLTTYEPLKKVSSPLKKTLSAGISIWDKLISLSLKSDRSSNSDNGGGSTETTSDGSYYEIAKREVIKIMPTSFVNAFQHISVATLAQDLQNIVELARAQGRNERTEKDDKLWKYLFAALIIIGAIVIMAILIVKVMD